MIACPNPLSIPDTQFVCVSRRAITNYRAFLLVIIELSGLHFKSHGKVFIANNGVLTAFVTNSHLCFQFRNQYDSDVTVWSPQGRLHQVEYAMEAVKLGTATVGLKNKDYAVLVALCKPTSELSDTQRKIIPIDDHLGISIAGLTADARVLSRYLRSECLNYKHSYDTTYPVSRLITNLGNKMQTTTQRYDRRPYGVGLLVAGYDERGPHIYQVTPSATFFNCKANSIGSRSQSARTYLEKNLNKFLDSSKDEIIRHGIRAILGTLPTDEQGKDAGQYVSSLHISRRA